MAAQEEGSQEECSHFYDHENLPPGYRFAPTDKELLYYLNLKILNKLMPIRTIIDVELYKYHPHDLCQSSRTYGKKEWYFFTSRAMKYNIGGRPNRTAANGYWKATGGDVIVQSNGQEVGRKKVLVYYEGKSKNQKTNWIMHEFTIHRMKDVARSSINPIPNDKMLDTCVCRIYYRTSKSSKNTEQDRHMIPTQDNNKTHVPRENLAVTSNQNPLPSALDQSSLQAGQSNNDQYPLVEPSNHMTKQRNIQYSLLPSPQPLAYIHGQYNPLLPPGTNMPGNCMAVESNDQYQPITHMNGDVGCSPFAGTSRFAAFNGIDDDDYLDITTPCFSSLSDLLPPTYPIIQSLPIHLPGQSNNDQYPPVEPSNHMTTQRNIQYSLLPSPQPLAYIHGQYNPLLPPGTNMPGSCMAVESNDQYQPITHMNGDVGCSPFAGTSRFAAFNGIDDDDYLDITTPCFSSLSDLLPPTYPIVQSLPIHLPGDVGCSTYAGTSNFAASTSTSNANEYIDLPTPEDWLDQLDMFLPPLDPTMLDSPLGESSNWLFQSENVHKFDGDVAESTSEDKM